MKLSFFLNKLQVIQNEFRLDSKNHILHTKSILHLGNLSWNIGLLCALNYRHMTPQDFIKHNNIQVLTKNAPTLIDKILFSSFDKTSNQIILYMDTIDWYLTSHAQIGLNKTLLINLLLSHEIFHFLQCHNHCILFNISCLDEIAAYAFAKSICNMHS